MGVPHPAPTLLQGFATGSARAPSWSPMTAHETLILDAAAQSHVFWLERLHADASRGRTEHSAEAARRVDACALGHWLHAGARPSVRELEPYRTVVEVHTRFHAMAGDILDLVLQGERAEALHRLDVNGEFMMLSGQLLVGLRALQAADAEAYGAYQECASGI